MTFKALGRILGWGRSEDISGGVGINADPLEQPGIAADARKPAGSGRTPERARTGPSDSGSLISAGYTNRMARIIRIAAAIGLLAIVLGALFRLGGEPVRSHPSVRAGDAGRRVVVSGTIVRSAPQAGAADTPLPAGAGPLPQYEPGEVLLIGAPDGFRAVILPLGFRVVETLPLGHLGLTVHRLAIPPAMSVPRAVSILSQRFPAARIDANHHYRPGAGPAFPASFARQLIGWQDLPEDCGKGLRIGMIDATVDRAHPALRGKAIRFRAFTTPGRRPAPASHGTAVAAILVGNAIAGKGWGGLVPGASLAAAGIFEVNRNGSQVATARGLLAAVDWLAGKRVQVVNLSIAGPDNRIVRLAVQRAVKRQLVLVAAAGNWGSASPPAYPAAYPEVIAVTAVSADGRVYSHANRGRYVDFAAPGVRMWTAVPEGGRYQSGTSFASPYISAMAALLISAGAERRSSTLRRLLRQHAIDLGPPGRDDVYGWGRVALRPACADPPR